jgi:predicted secreted acid phosphatase
MVIKELSMRNIFLIFYFILYLTPFCEAHSPSLQHEQLKEYYLSGAYFKEIDQKISEATDYLERQARYGRRNRLALVLDIDETSLSHYHDLARLHFTNNTDALTAAYMLGHAQAIPAVLHLYKQALNRQIAVFFISERPNTAEMVAITGQNLKQVGFDQWEELILKPIENNALSIQDFKTAARRHILAQGYDIIMNIGDQNADIQGGYAEIKVKLPNPFYSLRS